MSGKHKLRSLGQKLKQQRLPLPAIFVGVFALIGFGTLLFTQAASQPVALETEAGTRTANACSVTDASASGGAAIRFDDTCGTGTLPAGVTLQEIDGGADYYAQWSSSFPTDPNFFPIAVFNGFNLSAKAAGHKAAGINTYAGLYNGAESGSPSEIQVAKNLGMYTISGAENAQDSVFKSTWGRTAAGWVFQDEAEGNACSWIQTSWIRASCTDNGSKILTTSFINMRNTVRTYDTTRPIYNGFTNGFACNWYLNGPVGDLAKGSDIIGYDVYPKINTAYGNYGGCFEPGKDWGHYTATMSARANASFKVPIWPDLETTSMDVSLNPSGIQPTQADLKSIAWHNIIAGARGIAWFNNNFDTRYGQATQDAINDIPAVRTAVTAVNAQITSLASVINSPFANGYFTNTGSINATAKYNSGTGFYIFAASKSTTSQNVTFTVKSGSSVTVIDEGRTLPITGGKFSDTFSGESAYHLYKIN